MIDGSYSEKLVPENVESVGEYAKNIIVSALNSNQSNEIRLAGHSLGNQLATNVMKLIYDDIQNGSLNESIYKISRLALLDPAWTKDGKDYLGDANMDGENDWVGERCRWAIFEIINTWPDTAVEIYNTTALNKPLGIAMDSNSELYDYVCATSLRPWYYNMIQLEEKHNAALYHYFYTMSYDPPNQFYYQDSDKIPTGKKAPSAATNNSRIVEMMNENTWNQISGQYTYTPSDDVFECE